MKFFKQIDKVYLNTVSNKKNIMKKLFVAAMALSLLGFSACSNIGVDKTAVHNGLVAKMDKVLNAESAFWAEYFALDEGVDTSYFLDSVEDFNESFEELEAYFADTTFHTDQEVFVEQFNDEYKPFMEEYLEDVNEFAEKVENEGFTFAEFEPLFPAIDRHTTEFVDVHNDLIGSINVQSSLSTSGQNY